MRKGLGVIDRRIMKKIMSRLEYEFTASWAVPGVDVTRKVSL